jgi:cytochrome c peroxidase
VKNKLVAGIFAAFTAALLACHYASPPISSLKEILPSYISDSIYLYPGNMFSEKKAAIGRYLFYDRRLSVNKTKACASCHAQEFSFTDGYDRSIGALGDLHQRNSRPLVNLIFNKYLTAADSTIHFPEQQMSRPMLNDHPVEMGMKGNEASILERIRADAFYHREFESTFGKASDPFTIKNIQDAIACFIKTILSFNSPYDRFSFQHQDHAMNESQKRGMQLFFSPKLNCSNCHGGFNFSTPSIRDGRHNILFYFNTGLYNLDTVGSYPSSDQGLFALTRHNGDKGKFRVPTLRNLAFTAPYFHDGSARSLEDVIDVYDKGGRYTAHGATAGDGRISPLKDPSIRELSLNPMERRDLAAFLLSLSDSSICNNPLYANPFKEDETRPQHHGK